jgi:ferric-dicitrate binding protein FerR (iron transport regulator)
LSDRIREALERAQELRRTGQRTKALQILERILFEEDTNVQAWWLMAQTVEGPTEKRVALEHVLALSPNHGRAQRMLDELVERYPQLAEKPDLLRTGSDQSPVSAHRRRIVLIAAAVVLILALVLILAAGGVITLPGALTPMRSLLR